MSKNTQQCIAYLDFLGNDAMQYAKTYKRSYKEDVCVYALSANLTTDEETSARSNTKLAQFSNVALAKLNWSTFTADDAVKFAKSNSTDYMCYNFKLSNFTTDTDAESDTPYSYEEMFDENVLQHMDKSTSMQYSYIYDAYKSVPKTELTSYDKDTNHIAMNNFYTMNNLESTASFVRSDYYKFFVPETDIVHDRSLLEFTDGDLASVGNMNHEVFNCLLYCINPAYDSAITAGAYDMPKGFNAKNSVIPISFCVFSRDVALAGNNVLFEPNSNGSVTVE